MAPWMEEMSKAVMTRDSSDTNAYSMVHLGSDERQVLSSSLFLSVSLPPPERTLNGHLNNPNTNFNRSCKRHCWRASIRTTQTTTRTMMIRLECAPTLWSSLLMHLLVVYGT